MIKIRPRRDGEDSSSEQRRERNGIGLSAPPQRRGKAVDAETTRLPRHSYRYFCLFPKNASRTALQCLSSLLENFLQHLESEKGLDFQGTRGTGSLDFNFLIPEATRFDWRFVSRPSV